MNAIGLHHARGQGDALQYETCREHVVRLAQILENPVEAFAVLGTVVWRNPDPAQDYAGTRCRTYLNDFFQIFTDMKDRNAPQAVIASQFHYHQRWLVQLQGAGQAIECTASSFSRYAGIHHRVFVPLPLQALLQQLDPALRQLHVVAGAETVAQHQDTRAVAGPCNGRGKDEQEQDLGANGQAGGSAGIKSA